jgi:3',5'-cyclic AMP phosphodiesterase CpdA
LRRIPLLFCLAFVLTASSSAQTQVGFLAVGDYGVGGSREQALGQRMMRFEARHPANMLVTLGDNDYLGNPALFRANWQRAFGWARRSGLRVGGVLGNHDYELRRGAYELKTLGMPGRYYTRKLGDVQLFFLDSNAITTRQTRWLEQQLSESTATWKIALFHHPPYTCGGHAGDADVVRSWVPLFENYGVQLVLSGHDHNYQRFASQNGVTYVVDGGGGAGLYRLHPCPRSYPPRVLARKRHGFLYVSATDERLDVSALNTRGGVSDHVALRP